MSKSSWMVKKKRGDVLSNPRFGPLQVTIVEEELAPVTISDNESAGSTAYAGSAVSASTSNNREEVVISSSPQVGKDLQKDQIARICSFESPLPAVEKQHNVPHLVVPPRWSKSIDDEDSGRGVVLSPVESPKISPKLQSAPDECKDNGYISPQISPIDNILPKCIIPGGNLVPKDQGPVRVWVDALGSERMKNSQKISTPYIGERRVSGKLDVKVSSSPVAVVSDNIDSRPENPYDAPESGSNCTNAGIPNDLLPSEAYGMSESFNGDDSTLYQEQEKKEERAWDGAMSEDLNVSGPDKCEKEHGIIPYEPCALEGSQKSCELLDGLHTRPTGKGGDEDNVNSPTSSSAVSEDVDILRQRLGSPMPEEFYETVMTKSGELNYSNELFENAKEYLSHMLALERPENGPQKEIESPFSLPEGEDKGSSATPQSVDYSVQDCENSPESANNNELLSPKKCVRKVAGVSERKKQQLQWRDGESAIELSIRTKSDAARSGYLKYSGVEEDDSCALVTEPGQESSGEPELDIVPELAPIDLYRNSLPPVAPLSLERPSCSGASVISLPGLGSEISEDELVHNSTNFRHFVRELQAVARTGSIGQVRKILGVDDATDQGSLAFPDIDHLLSTMPETQPVESGQSHMHTQGGNSQDPEDNKNACERKGTVYYDAEDGPMFWEEETLQDVQNLAAQVISGGNDGVPLDSARTPISAGDMLISHDCQKQIGNIANQLRDVIKVRSRQLDSVCGSGDVFAALSPKQGISVFSARRDTPKYNPEKGLKRQSRRMRPRPVSESPSKTGGIYKLVSIFQRRRGSVSSRSEGSSLRTTEVQAESPKPSRDDRLEEIASFASFNKIIKPVMEPSASSSGALPPHPLHEVASVRQAMTSAELGLQESTSNHATASKMYHHPGHGSSASSTLEQRYCMLKLNFQLQGPGTCEEKLDSKMSENSLDSKKQVPKRSRQSFEAKASPKGSLSSNAPAKPVVPVLATPFEVSKPVEDYMPKNDVNQILSSVKKDVGTWVGPLTDKEFEFYSQFSGNWKADWEASDSYDSLCKVMKLGWVFRKGLEASNSLSFDISRSECRSSAKVIGCINMVERRPWVGTSVVHKRRDQRRGSGHCWVERYKGGLVLRIEWDDPLGGNIYEFVEMTADKQQMVVRQELYRKVEGLSSHTRLVFNRVA